MIRLGCLLFGYLFGLIQTGYIVGKIKGIDIRQHGSKNAGTTNILRTMGLKYAVIVLFGDAFKCIAAVLLAKAVLAAYYPHILSLLLIYTAAGVILGHNFPFYMGFKGGKGIAATAGFIISLIWQFEYGYVIFLLGLVVFFGTFFITHYVSLGSIFVYVGLFIEMVVVGQNGLLGFPEEISKACQIEYYIVVFLLACLAFERHKTNIKNLIKGTERKTYLKGRPEIDVDKKYADDKDVPEDKLNPM